MLDFFLINNFHGNDYVQKFNDYNYFFDQHKDREFFINNDSLILQTVIDEYIGHDVINHDMTERFIMASKLIERLVNEFSLYLDIDLLSTLLNKRMLYYCDHTIMCPLTQKIFNFHTISKLYAGFIDDDASSHSNSSSSVNVKYQIWNKYLSDNINFHPNGPGNIRISKYHRMWAIQTVIEDYLSEEESMFTPEVWKNIMYDQYQLIERLIVEFSAEVESYTMWTALVKKNQWAIKRNLISDTKGDVLNHLLEKYGINKKNYHVDDEEDYQTRIKRSF